MNTHIFNQAGGLGDIFFLQKLVYKFLERGDEVIFPIFPQLLFLNNYIKHKNYNFKFVSLNDSFKGKHLYSKSGITKEGSIINYGFHSADRFSNLPIMLAKYNLVKEDYSDWREYFNFHRNLERENYLYYDILKLTDKEEYNFINKIYGTPPKVKILNEVKPRNTKLKTVNLQLYENINIFDWLKVIENAKNFYSVETSFQYIMEKLNLTCLTGDMELWSRRNHFKETKDLFSLNYTEHVK